MPDGTDPAPAASFTFEVAIHAGLDAVWDLLSTSQGRAAWFGTNAQIDLVVGGASLVDWSGEQPIEATVAAVEPPRHLRLAYLVDGVELGAEEYWLEHDDGITHVRLLQSLPQAAEGSGWDGFYGDLERGWRLFLASLRYAAQDSVAPHRSAEGRFVPASSRQTGWAEALDRLGLDSEPALGETVDVALTGPMHVTLVDAPNSLLLTASDRTILLDLEGAEGRLVMYVQTATHSPGDTGSPNAWRHQMLDHLGQRRRGIVNRPAV